MSNPPSQKGRRRGAKDTREAILQAALRLFAQRGYDSTTTRMIAQEAGVAEGTIYIHFPSKRHLLFALLGQASLPVLKDILSASQETDDRAVLRALFRDRIRFGERYADLLRALLPQAMHDEQVAEQLMQEVIRPAAGMVKEYLSKRMQEGAFHEVPVEIATRMLVGAVWMTILFDYLLACSDESKEQILPRHNAEEYAEVFANLLLEGIRR